MYGFRQSYFGAMYICELRVSVGSSSIKMKNVSSGDSSVLYRLCLPFLTLVITTGVVAQVSTGEDWICVATS